MAHRTIVLKNEKGDKMSRTMTSLVAFCALTLVCATLMFMFRESTTMSSTREDNIMIIREWRASQRAAKVEGEEGRDDADDDDETRHPVWPVTDPSEDPISSSHETILTWKPPDNLPPNLVVVWESAQAEAKLYIKRISFGGERLRTELRSVKTKLVNLREELFREYYPIVGSAS